MTLYSPILAEWSERQAQLRSDAIAIQFQDRTLTYGELDARANR